MSESNFMTVILSRYKSMLLKQAVAEAASEFYVDILKSGHNRLLITSCRPNCYLPPSTLAIYAKIR